MTECIELMALLLSARSHQSFESRWKNAGSAFLKGSGMRAANQVARRGGLQSRLIETKGDFK